MSAPVIPVETYAHLKNQKVIAVVNLKGKTVEFVGTLMGLHARGIAIKPSGRANIEMISPTDLEDLRAVPAEPIKRKAMRPIISGETRQHIADRHGWKISVLNDEQSNEARAHELHESIDHKHLSHYHEAG